MIYRAVTTGFSKVRLKPSLPQLRTLQKQFTTVKIPSVTVYQYQICPFCNKVKALLSYAGVQHETVEVNPLTKAELKHMSNDYRKVPIAWIGDEQVNGSDEIMQKLLEHQFVRGKLDERWSKHNAEDGDGILMTMDKFTLNDEAKRWTTFANDELAPIIYPNICRSLSESHAAFGYVEQVSSFSATQKIMIRSIGSLAMYFAASKIKSKRNITDEREALHNALSLWEEQGLGSGAKTFSSGLTQPDMGDITMFGTLFSVQGLDAHSDSIEKRGGVVRTWYERMLDEVGV